MFWVANLASSVAGLGDLSEPEHRRTLDETTTTKINSNENSNFGLLFDTFVPLSSIVTIFIVVGFTLPRHEYFGLFWLVWWVIAVYVSLLSVDDDESNNADNRGGLFPSSSMYNRVSGVIVLIGLPLFMLFLLWMWWKLQGSSTKHQNRWGRSRMIRLPKFDPIKEFVLKHVPLWSMVAIHIYRLDGLSVLVPFWNGEVPTFVGYQTILLDVIMGITAIPLTYVLYVPRKSRARGGGIKMKLSPTFLRDALWFWNSLGLYDLSSAYVVFVLNVCGCGGSHITRPPLLPKLGRHPFPLLLLFQVPLAIAVHVLMLTHSEELMKYREIKIQSFLLTLPMTSGASNRR